MSNRINRYKIATIGTAQGKGWVEAWGMIEEEIRRSISTAWISFRGAHLGELVAVACCPTHDEEEYGIDAYRETIRVSSRHAIEILATVKTSPHVDLARLFETIGPLAIHFDERTRVDLSAYVSSFEYGPVRWPRRWFWMKETGPDLVICFKGSGRPTFVDEPSGPAEKKS